MGYLHIDNLYKNQLILQFKTVYALEKVHGTSAHIAFNNGELRFFSGGENYEKFVTLFDKDNLLNAFTEKVGVDDRTAPADAGLGAPKARTVVVFGEAYGGKQQGMSATYGPTLRFVAFDVKIGDMWLQVEQAHDFVRGLGLEFVDYEKIEATLPEIDRCRDLPSTQAVRNGIMVPQIREGVVLRPPFEVTLNNGGRLIAKHKRDEFRETKSPRVMDPEKQQLMNDAELIADEWVTPMRLEHVIDQLIRERSNKQVEMGDMGQIIKLMTTDIYREAQGEIVSSKEVGKAIGARTVKLVKAYVDERLREQTRTV